MFFSKFNSYKVKTTNETRTYQGDINDLRGCSNTTAREACYIYDRSNYQQQSFLNEILSPYIIIKEIVQVKDALEWDYPEEKTLSKKIESFKPPYEICSKISDLYNETVRRNLPTNKEREQATQQKKIEDGFNNFFK